MFKWLRNIFSKFGERRELPTQKVKQPSMSSSPELDKKISEILEAKGRITTSTTEWYKVTIHNPEPRKEIQIFQGQEISVDTLSGLKNRRIEKEKARIKAAEDAVRYKLAEAKVHIQTESVSAAEKALSAAYDSLGDLKSQNLWDDYRQLQRDLADLRETLRQREIERRAAEQRAIEEQERRRREEEEERRKRFEAEQKRIEAEKAKSIRAFERQLLTKEEKERKEQERLANLTKAVKPDADEIMRTLRNNNVVCLYHFTPRINIQSIKNHGGLYSWKYCDKNKLNIPEPGGDQLSRALDMRYGLEDYVRLSFCIDHPMSYRLREKDLVLLKIKIDVASLKDTLFSDINATDTNHHHGKTLQDLQRVDFSAIKRTYVRKDDDDFKTHQAEVLVRTHIPLEYIINLDNPIEMDFD